jgi:hypothetical protein
VNRIDLINLPEGVWLIGTVIIGADHWSWLWVIALATGASMIHSLDRMQRRVWKKEWPFYLAARMLTTALAFGIGRIIGLYVSW